MQAYLVSGNSVYLLELKSVIATSPNPLALL